VTAPSSPAAPSRLSDLWPGIIAATSFAIGDVYSKVALIDGGDVLTLSTFRSIFSVVVMALWLWFSPAPMPHTPRQRNISLGVGVLFAGIVFGLFKAIELLQVPVAILTYFIYPLLTGIAGALIGIDKLSWRGATAALVAFFGLALIVGAGPGQIAMAGTAFAVGAACCRTAVLLVTRAMLQGADARLITWYSMLSSCSIFVVVSLGTWNWQPPHTAYGWLALIIVGVTITIAVLALFISVNRIGPFRSALIMNLEPLLASILAVPLVGDVITPIQALGGIIMLAALVAFQLRR
jgi:drug/metabolite transporter (DMT)-like permease